MRFRQVSLSLVALLGVVLLGACGGPSTPGGVFDPYQSANREMHKFNTAADRAVIRPAAKVYTTIVPKGPATLINNFAFNFSEPRNVVNDLLQGRPHRALEATLRFMVNTTFGLGGLFDMAKKAGVPGRTTDFGETLYTWGLNEGPYMELPIVGPSTERHTVGRIADLFTNPLTYLLPYPTNYLGTAASLGWALDTRQTYAATVNDILDNSVDSYSQAQILYLQSRRHKLGEGKNTVIDPFQTLGLGQ